MASDFSLSVKTKRGRVLAVCELPMPILEACCLVFEPPELLVSGTGLVEQYELYLHHEVMFRGPMNTPISISKGDTIQFDTLEVHLPGDVARQLLVEASDDPFVGL